MISILLFGVLTKIFFPQMIFIVAEPEINIDDASAQVVTLLGMQISLCPF